MPRKVVDLLGQKFGRLTVIGRDYSKNKIYKVAVWFCSCDCGNITSVSTGQLRFGKTSSCGCYARELASKRMSKDKTITVANRIYNMCLHSAKARGYSFELDRQYFIDNLNSPCFYCYDNSKPHGYDRVDNLKGYTKDNLVTCCYTCNRAKHNLSLDTFLAFLDRIHGQSELPSTSVLKRLSNETRT